MLFRMIINYKIFRVIFCKDIYLFYICKELIKIKTMKYLKILVIILMAMQIGIISVGIYQLIDGKISKGLFNVLWNASFFLLNIYTLKIINQSKK